MKGLSPEFSPSDFMASALISSIIFVLFLSPTWLFPVLPKPCLSCSTISQTFSSLPLQDSLLFIFFPKSNIPKHPEKLGATNSTPQLPVPFPHKPASNCWLLLYNTGVVLCLIAYGKWYLYSCYMILFVVLFSGEGRNRYWVNAPLCTRSSCQQFRRKPSASKTREPSLLKTDAKTIHFPLGRHECELSREGIIQWRRQLDRQGDLEWDKGADSTECEEGKGERGTFLLKDYFNL